MAPAVYYALSQAPSLERKEKTKLESSGVLPYFPGKGLRRQLPDFLNSYLRNSLMKKGFLPTFGMFLLVLSWN